MKVYQRYSSIATTSLSSKIYKCVQPFYSHLQVCVAAKKQEFFVSKLTPAPNDKATFTTKEVSF